MADAAASFPPGYADQNKGPTILATCITMTSLSTIFVAARLFVRARIMGKLHLDDYLIIAAIICGWAAVGVNVQAVNDGNGRHFATLTPEQMSGTILWTIVGFCPGIMSFALPKLAVVALLTRIMNPARWQAVFMWFIALVCLMSLLGCVALLFAQCTPSSSQWDFSVKGKCWDPWVLVHYAIYAGSFSAFVDLYLAVYPACILFRLQMSLKKKLALSCALGIGSIATIVAIYKTTRIPSLASPDFSYDTSDLTMWTAIEGSTIIIASCIPILQPLLDLILNRRTLKGSSSGSSSKGRRQYQHYGTDRSGGRQVRSDIELSRAGGSRRPRGQMEISFMDLDTVNDPDAGAGADSRFRYSNNASESKDSQESILRQRQDVSAAANKGGKTAPSSARHNSGGIVRTDVVTIYYEADLEEGYLAGQKLPKDLQKVWQ